jgi:micrococcal nuclease
VRYIGIDAPEIYYKEKKAQPFGYAARDYNRQLIGNSKIYLQYDQEKKDSYKRLLTYVFNHNHDFLNQMILLAGYAYYLYKQPNTRHHDILLNAQHDAMRAKRGIWAQLKIRSDLFTGNKNTRRFHTSSCSFGKRISRRNRIEFNSIWEAFWQGYAPCSRCVSVMTMYGEGISLK